MSKALLKPVYTDQFWFGFLFYERTLRVLLVTLMNLFGFMAINIAVTLHMSGIYDSDLRMENCYFIAATCFCMAISIASAGRLAKLSREMDRVGAYACIWICLQFAGFITFIQLCHVYARFLNA